MKGCTGGQIRCKLQIRAVSKPGKGKIGPYGTGSPNALYQGMVAAKCKLREGLSRLVEIDAELLGDHGQDSLPARTIPGSVSP